MDTGINILIVERGPEEANRLRAVAATAGFSATVAASVAEALRAVRATVRPFAGAVVAAELEHEGELLLARLARLQVARVLVASGAPQDQAAEARARAAGASIFAARPVRPELLAAAVASAGESMSALFGNRSPPAGGIRIRDAMEQ